MYQAENKKDGIPLNSTLVLGPIKNLPKFLYCLILDLQNLGHKYKYQKLRKLKFLMVIQMSSNGKSGFSNEILKKKI